MNSPPVCAKFKFRYRDKIAKVKTKLKAMITVKIFLLSPRDHSLENVFQTFQTSYSLFLTSKKVYLLRKAKGGSFRGTLSFCFPVHSRLLTELFTHRLSASPPPLTLPRGYYFFYSKNRLDSQPAFDRNWTRKRHLFKRSLSSEIGERYLKSP